MNVPHDALFQNCINGSAPLDRRDVRAPEPLVQIQNYFTGLLLMMPFSNIAQLVPAYRTKGLPEL